MKTTTKHLYLVTILALLTGNLYFQYEQTALLEKIRSNTYSIPSKYEWEDILQKLDAIHTGINEAQRKIPTEGTEIEIRDLLKGLIRSIDIILDR
jgi:hypothetical protein